MMMAILMSLNTIRKKRSWKSQNLNQGFILPSMFRTIRKYMMIYMRLHSIPLMKNRQMPGIESAPVIIDQRILRLIKQALMRMLRLTARRM